MTRRLDRLTVEELMFLDAVAGVLDGRRADLGLSQQAVAERAGTSRTEVARAEGRLARHVEVRLTTLWKVIAALGWTGHEFAAAVDAELRRRVAVAGRGGRVEAGVPQRRRSPPP
ncbi:MAG TPA: helix-turn-helix transcriptional regulator [Mycobacteriales bacterium]|nr:helix-turn-helix transcriptional regulator [Mycobacteriales bacterium]